MRKLFLVIMILFLITGCSRFTEEANQEFGDQNFKSSIALIELHKVRTGEYPESLEDLEFLGEWDKIYLSGVEYQRLEEGYELNLVKGWIGNPEGLSYPDAFWEGLGLTKSNLK